MWHKYTQEYTASPEEAAVGKGFSRPAHIHVCLSEVWEGVTGVTLGSAGSGSTTNMLMVICSDTCCLSDLQSA